MTFRYATASVLSILALVAVPACGDDGNGGGGDTTTTTTTDATTTTTDNDAATTTVNDTSTTTVNDTTTTVNDTSTATDTTTVQDTTPPQDVVDPLAGSCFGILVCGSENCAGLTTQQEQQACLQTCAAGAPQSEIAAYNAFGQCMQSNSCIPTGPATDQAIKNQSECQRQNCRDETAACYAGTFSTGTCPQINACIQNCTDSEEACLRGCLQSGSEQAALQFINLNFCLLAECYSSTGTEEDFQTCAQQATSQPQCSQEYTECQGASSRGAGAGAGAGGGIPSDARAFFFPGAFAN